MPMLSSIVCRTTRLTIACLMPFVTSVALLIAPAAGGVFRVAGVIDAGNEAGYIRAYDVSSSDAVGIDREFITDGPQGRDYRAEHVDAPGIGRELFYDYIPPSQYYPDYYFEFAAFAGIAGLESRVDAGVRHDQTIPPGNGTFPVQASGLAVGRYDDVVVSGPAGSVTTSANLLLHGGLALEAQPALYGYSYAKARVEVNFYVNGSHVGGGESERYVDYNGNATPVDVSGGVLSGWSSAPLFSSPSFTVEANVPFALEVQLRTFVYASGYMGGTFRSSAASDFGGTLKFATAGAVFNLPGGYTANSTDAAIADNLNINPIAPPLEGDFNGDDVVDAADYVVWRKNPGGIYSTDDYSTWRAHFGQTAGVGSGANTNVAIPEPTTLTMCVAVLIGCSIANARQSHQLMRC